MIPKAMQRPMRQVGNGALKMGARPTAAILLCTALLAPLFTAGCANRTRGTIAELRGPFSERSVIAAIDLLASAGVAVYKGPGSRRRCGRLKAPLRHCDSRTGTPAPCPPKAPNAADHPERKSTPLRNCRKKLTRFTTFSPPV